MTTAAIRGVGVQVKLGDGATPEVFNKVAEVVTWGGPNLTTDTIEVTHMDSAGLKDYIEGASDGGELTFEVNLLPADPTHDSSTGLISAWKAGKKNWKIVLPDAGAFQFDFAAILTSFNPSGDPASAMRTAVTLKVISDVTFTP